MSRSKIRRNEANPSAVHPDSHGAGAVAAGPDGTVEVLYQKLGDRWFAFSLIDDEVFVGSISQDELDAAGSRRTRLHSISGNS